MAQEIKHSLIAVSVITEAEVLYGLAKNRMATRLRTATAAFFSKVSVLPWDSEAARAYAMLRVKMTAAGKSLSAMDMLIAAHAVATGAGLVTRDEAFRQVDALRSLQNWATDI